MVVRVNVGQSFVSSSGGVASAAEGMLRLAAEGFVTEGLGTLILGPRNLEDWALGVGVRVERGTELALMVLFVEARAARGLGGLRMTKGPVPEGRLWAIFFGGSMATGSSAECSLSLVLIGGMGRPERGDRKWWWMKKLN